MSSTLGLHSTGITRVVGDAGLHLEPTKRVIDIVPSKKSRLVFATEPEGLAVEQYKLVRRRLRALHPEGGVMLITSPSPGEGKTLTSVNLGWCLAEGGHRTCLVDLDFRAPGVSPTLGYDFEEDGVEDVLNGKITASEAIRQIGDGSYYVLGVRKRVPSPGDILSPSYLTPLLDKLRTMFQWVIVDSAPIIPMADVAEILPQVDGALMVVRAGKTEEALIAPALEILGAKVWGMVMNDCPINGSSYYGYYGNRKK
jgi:capsular exopolysaccharide synthesis family protein